MPLQAQDLQQVCEFQFFCRFCIEMMINGYLARKIGFNSFVDSALTSISLNQRWVTLLSFNSFVDSALRIMIKVIYTYIECFNSFVDSAEFSLSLQAFQDSLSFNSFVDSANRG